MELHVPTLAVVAVFVTAILGALLVFAWRRDQSTNALAWWGTGYLLGAIAFGLLAARGAIPDVLSVEIANATILVSYTFLLAGSRAFGGRDTPPTVFLIGPLIWLIALRVPVVEADINLRVVLMTTCQCTIIWMMTYEFWRERSERLLSRWPTMLVLVTHTFCLGLRIPVIIANPLSSNMDFFRGPIFAFMVFGTVLYTITLAFLLLSMTKERGELRHKTAALVDSLTGLANRRAFLDDADAVAARRVNGSEPLTVVLADLDRFKTINDRFGHAVGDRVLQVFADTITRALRNNDLSGRLGGEEFVFMLPGSNARDATQIAERIRLRFSEAARTVDGHAVASTVSIGVATTSSAAASVADLLVVADRALYQAKAAGRNRVTVIDCDAERAATGEAAPPLAPADPVLALPARSLNAA